MAEEMNYGVESNDTCANCGKPIRLSASFTSDYTFGSGVVGKKGFAYWHHGANDYFCDGNNDMGTKQPVPTKYRGVQNADYRNLYEQVIEKYEQLLFQLEELKREKNNLVGMQLPLPLVPAHE